MTVGTIFVDDLLDGITDYEVLDLTDAELDAIYDACEDIRDEEAIEIAINKKLVKLGFNYDHDSFVWRR